MVGATIPVHRDLPKRPFGLHELRWYAAVQNGVTDLRARRPRVPSGRMRKLKSSERQKSFKDDSNDTAPRVVGR